MRLYEVFTPELETAVRYRMLSAEEIEFFKSETAKMKLSKNDYTKAVLETVIFNLKSDIKESLRKLPKDKGEQLLVRLFNGCVMLNPGLDTKTWLKITSNSLTEVQNPSSSASSSQTANKKAPVKRPLRARKLTKSRFLNLERHLKERVIGQDAAIDEIVGALKRSQAGLNDESRPLGVFLFAGASGIGKTHLARELHKYMYGEDYDLIRVDCGEYQHKHENQKLLGAPPGYLGHDEGGQLTNAVLKNPHTVILLDEVEKAHADLWNTFLRVFDEGMMTDSSGQKVNFQHSIIIMTTNLGNREVVQELLGKGAGFGARIVEDFDTQVIPKRERVERVTREALRKAFNPEFLNRIDKIITFNHLSNEDFEKIAELELRVIENKLEKRGFSLVFDPEVSKTMVRDGVSSVQGARGLAQLRRDRIENPLADLILSGRYPRGTLFQVTTDASGYCVTAHRPAVKKRTPKNACSPPTRAV